MAASFASRLQPAPVDGGFAMDGWWVWCGSVIRGDDGRYHMFASRWPRALPFAPCWLTNSEIVRAVADTPVGPFEFAEVVLPARGDGFWDGKMTHNPTIHRSGDTYLLYYTGTTYAGPMPTPENPLKETLPEVRLEARANQRIGLATAPSVTGPWTRRDPILPTVPGTWDQMMNTNPAPCVLPSGEVLLVYKAVANEKDLLRMGVAKAPTFDGPYERLLDQPIFRFEETGDHVEDAYVWHDGDGFELIMKDMKGGICGEKGGGIHAVSGDGIHWQLSDPPLAYSRTVTWSDGSVTQQGHLERPQLLIEDGQATHFYAATMDGDGPLTSGTRSWNLVMPLAPA